MDETKMLPFKGTLVEFAGELVYVLGHLSILTLFRSGDNAKSIKVRHLIVNAVSPYNIIISKLTFNSLEASLSTLHLTMKYPLHDGWVRVIKGGQGLVCKCY